MFRRAAVVLVLLVSLAEASFGASNDWDDIDKSVAAESIANLDRVLRDAREVLVRSQARGQEDRQLALDLYRVAILERRQNGYNASLPFAERAHALAEAIRTDEEGTAETANLLAIILSGLRDFGRAEPLYDRALAIVEKGGDARNQDIAAIVWNMGILFERKGDMDRAEKFMRRSVTLDAKARGNAHFRVLERLCELGDFYFRNGRHADALLVADVVAKNARSSAAAYAMGRAYILTGMAKSAQRQLSAAEDFFRAAAKVLAGYRDLRTALAMQHLGAVLAARRQYPEAERWLQRALAQRQRILGDEHPTAVASMRDLGDFYRQAGQLDESEKLLGRVLQLRERAAVDADIASTLQSLALLRVAQRRPTEAIALRQRSLSLLERVHGTDSLALAAEINALASLYIGQRNADEAATFAARALAIQEKTLGADHLSTGATLSLLARAQDDAGQPGAAAVSALRAVAIYEKRLGSEHIEVAAILAGLARVQVRARKFDEADASVRRAVEIAQKRAQPALAATYATVVGFALLEAGEPARAAALLQGALAAQAKARGPEHAETGWAQMALASAQRVGKRLSDAESNYRGALAIIEKSRGPEHADTALAASSLAKVLVEQCRFAEAEPLYARALPIVEKAWGENSTVTWTVLSGVAMLRWSTGDFAGAESLLRRVSEAASRAAPTDAAAYSFSIEELLVVLQADQQKWDAAIASELGILRRMEGLGLASKPAAIDHSTMLAGLYLRRGDLGTADTLLQSQLPKAEAVTVAAPERTASILSLQAQIRLQQKKPDDALPLLRRAIDLTLAEKGPADPRIAMLYRQLARALQEKRQFAESELVLGKARAILESALGPNHPELATIFAELGSMQAEQFDGAGGMTNFKRARQIIEKAQRNGGVGALRSILVCPRMPAEELTGDL